MQTVGGDDIFTQEVEDTQFVEPLPWTAAVFAQTVVDLALCFAHVNMHRNNELFTGIGTTPQAFLADGVHGMGGDAVHLFTKAIHYPPSTICQFLTIAEEGETQASPYAAVFDRLCHSGDTEVHVIEERGTRSQHLAAGLQGSLIHQFIGQFLLGRPDIVVEPHIQRLVVAKATEEGHGCMRMHVAQSRENGEARGLD